MKTPAPQLNTRRLHLREISREDTDTIVAWRSNPQVYKYFLSAHALKREEHLVWYASRYLFDEKRYDFMAFQNETGEPVGVFGIKWWQDSEKEIELSYLVDPHARRKGYAKEAIDVLLDWAKKEWGSQKLIAEIHRDNTASIKFAENMGFSERKQDGNFIVFERLL